MAHLDRLDIRKALAAEGVELPADRPVPDRLVSDLAAAGVHLGPASTDDVLADPASRAIAAFHPSSEIRPELRQFGQPEPLATGDIDRLMRHARMVSAGQWYADQLTAWVEHQRLMAYFDGVSRGLDEARATVERMGGGE